MTHPTTSLARSLARRLVLCLAVVVAGAGMGLMGADLGPRPAVAENTAALDRVVLKSGRVVEGRILEEDDQTVRIMVMLSGIEAPATYRKSEVLSIERGVAPDPADAGATTTHPDDDFDATPERDRTGGPVVYSLKLDGMLISSQGIGSNPERPVIAPSTLRRALEDAASYHPEVVVVDYDVSAPSGLGGVLLAEDYGEVIEPFIEDGMRLVFWIKDASGGASLVPFSSSEIYFHPDATLGGLGAVGEIDRQDEWVNKKLLSAALGHAAGMAIRGGYSPEIIRGMCVEENWLAVRLDSGTPEYIEHQPRESDGEGWIILTDDGKGQNKDDSDKLEGNDVLNLDADWAYRLGVSKGAFDRLDDLVWELGVDDDYRVEEGRGTAILKDAAKQVERTVDSFIRLQQELAELPTTGNGAARRVSLLKRLSGLLSAQAEVLDPSGNSRAQIEIQIQQTRDAVRRANQNRRR